MNKNWKFYLAAGALLVVFGCGLGLIIGAFMPTKSVDVGSNTLIYIEYCGFDYSVTEYRFDGNDAGTEQMLQKETELTQAIWKNRACEALIYHKEWDEILFYKPRVLTSCYEPIALDMKAIFMFKEWMKQSFVTLVKN